MEMEVSHKERESDWIKRAGWTRAGRGKGLRWQLLRELVALSSLAFWTTSGLQDAMVHLRGISWSKTIQLLEELERAEVLFRQQENQQWVWSAIPSNADYWIGSTENIPAGIVQAASRFGGVKK